MSKNTISIQNDGHLVASSKEEIKAILYLWVGAGYALTPFYVATDDLEEAMGDVLVYCQKHGYTNFYSEDDSCEDDFDSYIYIDPTLNHPKSAPAYLYIMNMSFVTM